MNSENIKYKLLSSRSCILIECIICALVCVFETNSFGGNLKTTMKTKFKNEKDLKITLKSFKIKFKNPKRSSSCLSAPFTPNLVFM